MFDATSDLREEGDSFDINTKGLVTFDRKVRKDAFWFYKAAWSSAPVLYLTGRRYVDRAYPVTDVRAYSNAAQAQLSVNGRPIGSATCVDHACVWPGVRLAAGDNRIKVAARIGGKAVTDDVLWRYTGPADALHLRMGSLTGATLADGTRYGSDTFFTGGTGFTLNPYQKELYANGATPPAKIKKTVAGARSPELYGSWRAGPAFSYALPVPDGRYRVTLHLMEPTEVPGKRVFSVAASGGAQRDGIDVAALAGGPLRAMRIELPGVAAHGVLKLDFRGITGQAIVSAIDVMPAR
jgi:beta-galactosidase